MHMKKVFHVLLMLFITGIVSITYLLTGTEIQVEAEGKDISDQAVTGISLSASNVDEWEDATVTINFEEDANSIDIKADDYIKVSWPTESETNSGEDGSYLTGYEATLNLTFTPEGSTEEVSVGTAEITTDGAVISFNDNVKNYQHVKGKITFTVKAHGKVSDDPDGSTKLTIKAGNESAELTVGNDTGAVGPDEWAGKNGDWDETSNYTRISWRLLANTDYKEDIALMTITDTVPDGQEYAGIFELYVTADDTDTELLVVKDDPATENNEAIDAMESLGMTVTEPSASNSDTLSITIPGSAFSSAAYGSATEEPVHVSVYYYADLTESYSGGETVSNTASFSEKLSDGTVNTMSATDSVIVPSSGAGIDGVPKGTLQIQKVVDGTAVPVEGVMFHVYKLNSETSGDYQTGWYNGADYAEITTDAEGEASLAGLDDGYYEIVECSAPDWLVITTQNVIVQLGGSTGTSTIIKNGVQAADVTAEKIWHQSDGGLDETEHPTTWFTLYRKIDDGQEEAVSGSTKELTDGTESVTWENMPQYDNYGNQYTYLVHETDAEGNDAVPDGYTKKEEGLTVTNTRKEDSRTVYDSLTLKKTDTDGNVLNGAVFTLYDGEEAVQTYNAGTVEISSQDLAETLDDSDSKTFILKETSAPNGYTAGSERYEMTLKKSVSSQWEGEGDDKKYVTITTYTLSCAEAVNDVLTVENAKISDPKPEASEKPNETSETVPTSSPDGNPAVSPITTPESDDDSTRLDYPTAEDAAHGRTSRESTAVTAKESVMTGIEDGLVKWSALVIAAGAAAYFIEKKRRK
jgi:hypothetical protein